MENCEEDPFQLGQESYFYTSSFIKPLQCKAQAESKIINQQNRQIQKSSFVGLSTKLQSITQSQGMITLFKKKDGIQHSEDLIEIKQETSPITDRIAKFMQKSNNSHNLEISSKSKQQIFSLRTRLLNLQNKQKNIKQKFEKIVKTLELQLEVSQNRNNQMRKRIILINTEVKESKNDVEQLKTLIKNSQIDFGDLKKLSQNPPPVKRQTKSISPETLSNPQKSQQKNQNIKHKKQQQSQYRLPKISHSPKQKNSTRKLIGNN